MEHRKRSLRHAILGQRATTRATTLLTARPIERSIDDRSIPSGDRIIETHDNADDDDEKKIHHSRGWHEIFTRLFLFGNILWISSLPQNTSRIRSRRGGTSDATKSSSTTKGRIISILTKLLVIAFGLIIIIIFASFVGSTTTSIYFALRGGGGYENRLQQSNKGYFSNLVMDRKDLYQSFSKLLTFTPHGDVPPEYLPQRPRAMSLVASTTAHQQQFPRQERWEGIAFHAIAIDPNKVPSHTTKGRTIHVSKKALSKQAKLHDSESYDGTKPDIFEKDDCERLYDWQLTSYPSCNIILEQDMTDLGWSSIPSSSDEESSNDDDEEIVKVKLLGNGYFRDVWKLTHVDDTTQKQQQERRRQQHHGPSYSQYVLKTMRYFHSFSERNYDRHRRDAVAMERLSASEHVVDIYAFCGNSGVFQYADGGDLEENVWNNDDDESQQSSGDDNDAVGDDHHGAKVWNSTEKLLVAYQLAAGLADVHRLNIAHADISHGQFVYVSEEGRFRLNDFNRCRFIRWNKKLQDFCPFKVGSNPGGVRTVSCSMFEFCFAVVSFVNILVHWIPTFLTCVPHFKFASRKFRSPEEYRYSPETIQIDVYSLGNIFYGLLTRQELFGGKSSIVVKKFVKQGVRSEFPPELLNSSDPATAVLIEATQACWIDDPTKRATSQQIKQLLSKTMEKVGLKPTDYVKNLI